MRIPAARWIAFRPIVDGIRLTIVPLGGEIAPLGLDTAHVL